MAESERNEVNPIWSAIVTSPLYTSLLFTLAYMLGVVTLLLLQMCRRHCRQRRMKKAEDKIKDIIANEELERRSMMYSPAPTYYEPVAHISMAPKQPLQRSMSVRSARTCVSKA